MDRNATAKIAQFVVIRGKYIPNARYKSGRFFFMNISSNCTRDAIVNMKEAVRRNSKFSGFRRKWYTHQLTAVEIVITNITAKPIPMDEEILSEMPKNEQRARKRMSMILFTKNALKKIRNIFISLLTIEVISSTFQ
jgi:predicted nucleic acid-binding Zn ribbon protein